MRLIFAANGWEDHTARQFMDRAVLQRLHRVIDDGLHDPFEAIGKPERLKYARADVHSQHITDEHPLVYLVVDDNLIILPCRYRYKK